MSKQADLAKVKNASDDLCQGLAPEGAVVVKNRVQELKNKVMKLGEEGQKQANFLADKIIERLHFILFGYLYYRLYFYCCSSSKMCWNEMFCIFTGKI